MVPPLSLNTLMIFLLQQLFQPSTHSFHQPFAVSVKKTIPTSTSFIHKHQKQRSYTAPAFHDTIKSPTSLALHSSSNNILKSSFLLTSDSESWRQYVPLIVSLVVIIDILLGSPLVNMVLLPMRRASERGAVGDSVENDRIEKRIDSSGASLFSSYRDPVNNNVLNSKERVDSEAIAKIAIDKARNTLELRRFLEENKSDEQKYEEIRRKLDKQMNELNDNNKLK